MRCIYHHQRANGLQREASINEADKGIGDIPCPDSETSLHLRIYLTCGTAIDLESTDHIIRSILDKSNHQKIWITIVPAFFGNEVESRLDLFDLIKQVRNIDRVDQIGIAFDNTERLLNNDIDIDFYGMRFSVIRHNKNIIKQFKNLPKMVYSIPEPVVESSRYIESLDACRYKITMVEYSSYEENRMVINDHGFIYQIQDNQN